jgi:hypothetical protein
MTLVWDIHLPDSDKIVLLALADNANDDGVCWPSIATIARKCSKDERTVQRVITRLKEAGHVSMVERKGTSNLWTVHPRHEDTPGKMPPRHGVVKPPVTMPPKPLGTVIPKKTTSSRVRARKTDADYVRLPDDWKPERFNDGTAAREVVDRRGIAWAKAQFEDFKAWAANADDKPGKGRKLDWQAAFSKWINEQDKRDGRNGTGRNGTGSNNQPVDGFTRALRKVSASGAADDF